MEKDKKKKTKLVKLMKFVDGMWKVVDFGIKSKTDLYVLQGYVVID